LERSKIGLGGKSINFKYNEKLSKLVKIILDENQIEKVVEKIKLNPSKRYVMV